MAFAPLPETKLSSQHLNDIQSQFDVVFLYLLKWVVFSKLSFKLLICYLQYETELIKQLISSQFVYIWNIVVLNICLIGIIRDAVKLQLQSILRFLLGYDVSIY